MNWQMEFKLLKVDEINTIYGIIATLFGLLLLFLVSTLVYCFVTWKNYIDFTFVRLLIVNIFILAPLVIRIENTP